MLLKVCRQCDKVKKKNCPKGHTRISGQKIYQSLLDWLDHEPQETRGIIIKSVKCLDKCSDGPIIFNKNSDTFFKALTEEELEELKKSWLKNLDKTA